MIKSPYSKTKVDNWQKITETLISEFPLSNDDMIKIVFGSWNDIFKTNVGGQYKIGKDIMPQPQIMGFLLHELIPLNLSTRFARIWRRGEASTEFDAHYIPNEKYSFEIKTSSSTKGIFGNRSYAQISDKAIKRRGGYLLAVNFEKFEEGIERPNINLIRFGWLDPADWIGQKAQSGQQSHLTKEARAYKLKILWDANHPKESSCS